jgi:hypothetical protein
MDVGDHHLGVLLLLVYVLWNRLLSLGAVEVAANPLTHWNLALEDADSAASYLMIRNQHQLGSAE